MIGIGTNSSSVGWSGASADDGKRLGSLLAVIVDMPVVGPDGREASTSDVRVFLTERTVGEIGVVLGVLLPGAGDEVASRYAPAIIRAAINEAGLRAIRVEIAQVHVAFDSDRAAELAGHRGDTRQAVLVGAGAIGSHLIESLVREGRFVWGIVDDDHLLPHNIARHTLSYPDVGRSKAVALQERLNTIFAPDELFRKSPPAWIGVAELDILRDEGIAYGEKLKAAGVAAEVKVYKGAPHPIMAMDGYVARDSPGMTGLYSLILVSTVPSTLAGSLYLTPPTPSVRDFILHKGPLCAGGMGLSQREVV